ncbi:MAG: type II 3-dehydroquinate dehydratase [Flavobacteriales bacterium]
MKKIAIVNGPNLNLLGSRETSVYGSTTFEEYFEKLKMDFPDIQLDLAQNNVEGELVNLIQQFGKSHHGIVLNAAAYTHTSVAIADAIAAIDTPVLEVHISNIYAREEFRQTSLSAPNCIGIISGLGLHGYHHAISHFKQFV